jgi:hypothetical protein
MALWPSWLACCRLFAVPHPEHPRSFSSLFVGSDELEKAATVIGWIAINYTAVEDGLNYLIWQLEAYKTAQTRRHKQRQPHEQQEALRNLRRNAEWRPIASGWSW